MPASEMLYDFTADYHWDRFDVNSTASELIGGWKPKTGFAQGPFGFGKAISLKSEQASHF